MSTTRTPSGTVREIVTATHLSNAEVSRMLFTLWEIERLPAQEPARNIRPFTFGEAWRARMDTR